MAVTTKNIFIFGASCSGKSTLGAALSQSLGREWTYLDRDALVESGECTDDTVNVALDEKIQQLKSRIIVDAQIPWRVKQPHELYFLVSAPLQTLLARDTERAETLHWDPQFAQYAKDFVIETHQTLANTDQSQFDACFDSSQLSVSDEVQIVNTFLT